jgi:L-seryl-tRNA(Ser) seleniumtransferase
MSDNPLRDLPSVTEVLAAHPLAELADVYAHVQIVEAVRDELHVLRELLKAGEILDGRLRIERVAGAAAQRLCVQQRLRPVINATGIILHTNLGRAPLAEEAARAAYDAARQYCSLEFDLESGGRSSRQAVVREWICRLTDAESATAVNNNAAATIIALRALARGKEVIVARGQLVEIGGSFRIPEIMATSGAILREVGTTNVNRRSDYEQVIGPQTGALMRVHASNFRISGFTQSTSLEELIGLAKSHGLPFIDDVGSGALFDFAEIGFREEPGVRRSISLGADLVLFSGDKLLGGPQAGIIAGRADLIERIEKDPLMRAFRLDKMTLAALEATLRLYANPEPQRVLPLLRMLTTPLVELKERTARIASGLQNLPGIARAEAHEGTSFVGGGSLPDQSIKTCVLAIAAHQMSDEELAARLRKGNPPVIGRLHDGMVLLDLRTVFVEQEELLFDAVKVAAGTD